MSAETRIPSAVPSPAEVDPAIRAVAPIHLDGLTKFRAEEILDWLEAHGQRGQLSISKDGSSFQIDCDCRVETTIREAARPLQTTRPTGTRQSFFLRLRSFLLLIGGW